MRILCSEACSLVYHFPTCFRAFERLHKADHPHFHLKVLPCYSRRSAACIYPTVVSMQLAAPSRCIPHATQQPLSAIAASSMYISVHALAGRTDLYICDQQLLLIELQAIDGFRVLQHEHAFLIWGNLPME